jgi:hypothetical protein
MDMKFGTCSVRNLYRVGSLMRVSRELVRYNLDLGGVQEVRWEGGGTEPAGERNENHELVHIFWCIRKSYQQLRGLSLLVIGCHT